MTIPLSLHGSFALNLAEAAGGIDPFVAQAVYLVMHTLNPTFQVPALASASLRIRQPNPFQIGLEAGGDPKSFVEILKNLRDAILAI